MNVNQEFFYDVVLLSSGLFLLGYIIYGRIKRKSLIGGYKSGEPGYDIFLKFVMSTRYLIIVGIGTLLLTVKTVFDILAVLRQPSSHSILVVAPLMVIVTYAVLLEVLPAMLGKKR